jgi:hypothetical protein
VFEQLVLRDEAAPPGLVVVRLGARTLDDDLLLRSVEECQEYDLWYDATSVGADLVVETWISHGPRSDDPTFDPCVGDWLLVGDDEEAPCRARVIRREGNRVRMQLELGRLADVGSGRSSDQRD